MLKFSWANNASFVAAKIIEKNSQLDNENFVKIFKNKKIKSKLVKMQILLH